MLFEQKLFSYILLPFQPRKLKMKFRAIFQYQFRFLINNCSSVLKVWLCLLLKHWKNKHPFKLLGQSQYRPPPRCSFQYNTFLKWEKKHQHTSAMRISSNAYFVVNLGSLERQLRQA